MINNIFNSIGGFFQRGRFSALLNEGLSDRHIVGAHEACEYYQHSVILRQCVDLISDAIADLPLKFQTKKADGSFEDLENSRLETLLENPFGNLNRRQFIKEQIAFFLVTGECFAIRRGLTQAVSLQPVPSYGVELEQDLTDGMPRLYRVTYYSKQETFPIEDGVSDVFHFKNLNLQDPNRGCSSLSAIKDSLDGYYETIEFNRNAIKGVAATHQLTTETPIPEEKRSALKADLQTMFSGAKNASKTVVLPKGVKIERIGEPASEMHFEKASLAFAKNIAHAFHIAPEVLGLEGSKFENLQIAKEAFYTDAVLRVANKYFEELSMFLDRTGKTRIAVDDERIAALEPKRERRAKRLAEQVQSGLLTPNEAREINNQEPYSTPEAEIPYMPRNFVPLSLTGGEEEFQDPGFEE